MVGGAGTCCPFNMMISRCGSKVDIRKNADKFPTLEKEEAWLAGNINHARNVRLLFDQRTSNNRGPLLYLWIFGYRFPARTKQFSATSASFSHAEGSTRDSACARLIVIGSFMFPRARMASRAIIFLSASGPCE